MLSALHLCNLLLTVECSAIGGSQLNYSECGTVGQNQANYRSELHSSLKKHCKLVQEVSDLRDDDSIYSTEKALLLMFDK